MLVFVVVGVAESVAVRDPVNVLVGVLVPVFEAVFVPVKVGVAAAVSEEEMVGVGTTLKEVEIVFVLLDVAVREIEVVGVSHGAQFSSSQSFDEGLTVLLI